jgi:hypothetical protein
MEVLGSEIKVGQSIFAPPYGWIEVTAIDKTDQGFLVITGACDSVRVAKVRKICSSGSRYQVASPKPSPPARPPAEAHDDPWG